MFKEPPNNSREKTKRTNKKRTKGKKKTIKVRKACGATET